MTSKIQALKAEAESLKSQLAEKRAAVADAKFSSLISDVPSLGKVSIRCRMPLRGHLAKIYALDWDKESRNLVSASQDGKLIVWNALTGLKLSAIALRSSWVMTCSFSPSGNFVACGGLDNICAVYNLMGNDSKPRIHSEHAGHQGYISSCQFIGEEKIITASGDSSCTLWDIEANKSILDLYGHTSDVMKVCLKPGDMDIVATGSCDRSCKLWDLRIKSPCIQTFETHEEDINSIAFTPSGNQIGTASDDGTSRLFDSTADQEIAVYTYESSSGTKIPCTSISFSSSGRIFFAGLIDHTVCIRDTLRGDIVGRLTDHDNRVSCLSVAPNGTALCTGSWDNLLRIYA